MSVRQADIERTLRELGLGADSHVLVHTSYKAIGGVEGGPEAVARALVETLGTVLMPSFTSYRTAVWDPRGLVEHNAYPAEPPADWDGTAEPFTYDTPANRTMGVINETFRRAYPVARSANPMVSFVAYGALAEELCGEPGTAVDAVEPIRRLMEAGGDLLLLGVTHTNSTSIHLAEQLAGREQFLRYAMTPGGVRAARSGGCGNAFIELQPHVEHMERRAQLGNATLRCYALQPYVEIARQMIERDPYALLCDCDRCRAHKARVAV
ncbi:MAG: AAC(3) family N-acetyltransferase [Dehalococcoidia bacterium]